MDYRRLPFCGCWSHTSQKDQHWLPQVDLKVQSKILSATARTKLTQTFINASDESLKRVYYTFPLYDGVSVVSFKCTIGDRVIRGVVKEREEAKAQYEKAVQEGKKAALMQQSMRASDTFTTSIGNIPANSKAVVEITYLGELQHDAQADGVRFTIPNKIAPRYASQGLFSPDKLDLSSMHESLASLVENGKIDITVDVAVDKGSTIRGLQSPSHPISISLGRMSTSAEDVFEKHYASATLTMQEGNVLFENDFVLIVKATEQEIPAAFLETHPTLPGQRAVMATLVPKFNLPNNSPEIVFIIDRSGSMTDKIKTLRSALKVFLKSLPVGTKFNICSFGSHHSFLWKKSRTYEEASLKEALEFADTIQANMGGTEIYQPVEATVDNRFKDLDLEILLLTDGEIWDQASLFRLINEAVTNNPIRVFSLGIGDAASHSLIQGIARAGDGFAQSVGNNEQLDKKVVRMLKGALTPHVKNYCAEIEYGDEDDEFEIVEKANELPDTVATPAPQDGTKETMDVDGGDDAASKPAISLFDPSFKETDIKSEDASKARRVASLPDVPTPKILQAPYKIPSLYPFNRTTVYLLLSPESSQKTPKSLILKGTSKHGPLTLKIPIEDVGEGLSIHQLAARKIGLDIEEGRGWVSHAKDKDGKVIVDRYESRKEHIIKREAVRLGVRYQVAGKFCSFVAVEGDPLVNRPKDGQALDEVVKASAEIESDSDMFEGNTLMCVEAAGTLAAPRSRMMMAQRSYAPPPTAFGMGSMFSQVRGGPPSPQATFCSMPTAPSGGPVSAFGASRQSDIRQSDTFGANNVFAARRVLQGTAGGGEGKRARMASQKMSLRSNEKGPAPSLHPANGELHGLISLQNFDGSWEWREELFNLMKVDVEAVDKLDWAPILGNNVKIDHRDSVQQCIIATLLAVAYLHHKWSSEMDTWELVADKADGWVKTSLAGIGGDARKPQEHLLPFFVGVF